MIIGFYGFCDICYVLDIFSRLARKISDDYSLQRDLIVIMVLSDICYKGDVLYDLLFPSSHATLLTEKESTLKGKNLLPFRVDPFPEWRQQNYDRVFPLDSVSFPLKQTLVMDLFYFGRFGFSWSFTALPTLLRSSSSRSVNLGSLIPLSHWPLLVHILSSVTDNSPSGLSRREIMISWSI